MTPSRQDLAAWLAGPRAGRLQEQERAFVAAALECAFGLHCLQVGAWGAPQQFLARARTRRSELLARARGEGVALVCEPEGLALQSDSVDVLLLPHTLEFARDPHEVLREAGRVLTGEGELLVLGFEPWGLWSLRSHFTRGGSPPGIRRTIGSRRLSDWLKLLGFEVGGAQRFLYGAYLLHARKRVYTMTPMRLRNRLRTAVIGGLAEPAARRAS
ncbi:MAG: class I SAM-dependent methyltransferase [Gammaproteobacteria bacterium]